MYEGFFEPGHIDGAALAEDELQETALSARAPSTLGGAIKQWR